MIDAIRPARPIPARVGLVCSMKPTIMARSVGSIPGWITCMALAATMNGRSITTSAGLAFDGLNAVQQAFIDQTAVQCGYCTPGMVVKSTSLLRKNPNPTEEEIRKELEGNICRCTGYDSIVKAVQQAAKSFPETDAKWDNAVEVKAGVNA